MRIAVCLPAHRQTEALFTLSFGAALLKAAATLPHEIRIFLAQGTILDARNTLAEAAIGWGADWLQWFDVDQTFPEDTLNRLLAHGVDVVGCNYPRRRPPDAPTAAKDGRPLYTTAELARAGTVQEVDTMGLGVCLMRASVFDALERPWFTFEKKASGPGHVTEDVAFFRALKRTGIAAHVDHGLSWEVGHVAEQVLTNAGTGSAHGHSSYAPSGAG